MGQVARFEQEVSPSEKFATLKIIAEDWMSVLSPTEHSVAMFIWHRTYWWGKKSENIRFANFLNGIPKVIGGLPISKATLRKSIKTLEGKGFLTRKQKDWHSCYMLNFKQTTNAKCLPKKQNAVQKFRKPREGQIKTTGGSSAIVPGGVKNCNPYKYDNNNNENKKNENKDSGEESPQFELARNDFKESKQRKELLCNNKKILYRVTVPDLERLWLDEIKKVHSEYPCLPWSGKECGQVKKFLSDFRREHPDKDISEFFLFVIDNWNRIDARYFKWLKNISYPEYPCVQFLIGFKKQFLTLFGDNRFHDWKPGVTAKEREIKKLKRMGYTEEQAEKAYAEQLESSGAVLKQTKLAEQAMTEARHAIREKEKTDRRMLKMMAEREKEFERLEKLNRGSKTKPEQKKKKRDKDGYAIFEG